MRVTTPYNDPEAPDSTGLEDVAADTEPQCVADESLYDDTVIDRERQWEFRRRQYPNGLDILAIAGIILISSLAAAIVGGLLGAATRWDVGMLNAVVYFLQMGLAILLVSVQRRVRKAPQNVINLRPGRVNAPLILWGILLIFVTGVVIEPLLGIFPDRYLDQLNQYIGTGGWAILMTVVLAPVMEETLFRGIIQGSICRRDGAVKAILLSALLFGAFHIIPQQAINAFLVGIILGYIYFRTGSLLSVIILHALNNGISYLLLEVLGPARANMSMREMLGNDTWYYIVYSVCVALLIVGAVMIYRSLRSQDRRESGVLENNM